MSSMLPYELKGLPHDDCVSLFRKWAFNDGDDGQYPNLMRIGEDIVKKCKGIPLAVRTLGSLLFAKTDESEWMTIRDSEIWRLEQSENDILPVLKLSYNYLPPYLQRCLACLSLYKKDYLHPSDDVILFWMANGLLEHPKQNEEWEDVGKRYLKELWSRCFIQDVEIRSFYFVFKVHDLIHDLLLDVSQKECKILYSQTEGIDEKVRHISFCDDHQQLVKFPQALKNRKYIRTVFLQQSSCIIDLSFVKFCVSNFKYLRALDLSGSPLKALPDSVGTLKHLRYVGLRGCRHLRKIPGSFYKLQSLVMLKMMGVRVPSVQLHKMQSFVRLRYLEISVKALPSEGIQPRCWPSLQYLAFFVCDFEWLFEEIQYLTSLRTLNLFVCPKLVSLPRSLKFLTKLEHLQIQRCGAINLHMELEEEEDHHLQLSLKTFTVIQADALTDLPRLLLEGSSSTLQWITLSRCSRSNDL
ncbi:Disease resistance protein [Corchorus olitorius]|uniref:Disease resistance protein n=1 Tax=Corchorus olitorius TaxID=93759 RepID=A0A1R3GB58_9ROSI|nr:Disease resistance protein [Corchorus olitorius]